MCCIPPSPEKQILCKKCIFGTPESVLPAGELRQDAGSELSGVLLTGDHHTSPDVHLLQPGGDLKSNVVSRHQAPPLFVKHNLVLESPVFYNDNRYKKKKKEF